MRDLVAIYRRAHNVMRSVDGLQPQEAFEELLKFLFFKQLSEEVALVPTTATAIRNAFGQFLREHNSWSTDLWRDKDFHLSDICLEQISTLFERVNFKSINFDIRSAALREFLTPNIRKGLGIYLTPDEVVREIVNFVEPPIGARCIDPACGSGTFLIELVKFWQNSGSKKKLNVWGVDKNPRMLLLGELNLGHFPSVNFHRANMDSLVEPNSDHPTAWCRHGYFDFVLTNPPFGVTVDTGSVDFAYYDLAFNENGNSRIRQASEWLFIEQSLRWLKPGGTLGIVLPKSVLTNPSSSYERSELSKYGFVKATMLLPPETFLVAGAQTNAVVVFIKKYQSVDEKNKTHDVVVANLNNVGYDSTGRQRSGSQLEGLAQRMKNPNLYPCDEVSVIHSVSASDSFEVLSVSSVSRRSGAKGTPLGDLVSKIKTGKTPPRVAYSDDEGLFLIKVGNLTGAGIKWTARDRNFVDTSTMTSRRRDGFDLVASGDIVLTSSAHSPVYIAKKVDIITEVPEWVGGQASFVGEVMLVRAKREIISPYLLLAYLRQPQVSVQIQSMIRGQTAHLHADDLGSLTIPDSLFELSDKWESLEKLLSEETQINDKLNALARQQQLLFSELAKP